MSEPIETKQPFDRAALEARRDAALEQGEHWALEVKDLNEAYEAGMRDFRYANLQYANLYRANLESANLQYANLYRANLQYADLYSANLESANLRDAIGIYSAYASNLSSRNDSLSGGVVIEDGKLQLRFWAGCKSGITASLLREMVAEAHGENIHAIQYEAAIKFIESCFEADMKFGKWDYLLELNKPAGTETPVKAEGEIPF